MTILCYHEISEWWDSPMAVRPEVFEAHCRWLARHRDVVDLQALVDSGWTLGTLPERMSAITFDDGFTGVLRHGLPVLRRHKLPATVFVVAATLDHPPKGVDWVDDPPPQPVPTLTADELLTLREGGVRIGSHSWQHHDLSLLGEAECRRDLRASRELLEDVLREPVTMLAYPRGSHAPHVQRAARDAGFQAAFTLPTRPEPIGPLTIPRVGVYPRDGVAALWLKAQSWFLPLWQRETVGAVRPLVRRLLPSPRRRAPYPVPDSLQPAPPASEPAG